MNRIIITAKAIDIATPISTASHRRFLILLNAGFLLTEIVPFS
jgi:hypothetical protein